MGKKKRLKAHVQRHMERRRRGAKKPRLKIFDKGKKVEDLSPKTL
ncbi:MAG: hypothetical protein QQN41_09245 [Nitrosopumilus sp.]